MASLLEEDLTSLDKEDIFIGDTTKLARLFFELEHKQNVTGQLATQDISKGVGASRLLPQGPTPAAEPAATDEDTRRLTNAAVYVGQRLREMAPAHEATLTRAFNSYVAGLTRTIFDMNYETFQRIMSEVISAQQDQFNQIVLIFAGALHISKALRDVGNDMHRQEEYARYVGRSIVEQGLMPLVEQLGGWEQIGQAHADGTPV